MFEFFKKSSVRQAADTLGRYDKIDKTIAAEVANIQFLIAELQASERELRDAETAEALNEQSAVSPTKARKRLEAARAAIDTAARRLDGLRARLLTVVGEAPAKYEALTRELPAITEQIRTEFEEEWTAAAKAFSVVLGRRAAIERLTGATMSLPEPSPTAVELEPELSLPYEQTVDLKAAIERAVAQHSGGRSDKEIDPYRVHILKRPSGGLPEGTLVLSCSFPVGKLASLVEANWAGPVRDPEASKAAFAAKQALLGMEATARQRAAEAEESRIKAQFGGSPVYENSPEPMTNGTVFGHDTPPPAPVPEPLIVSGEAQ